MPRNHTAGAVLRILAGLFIAGSALNPIEAGAQEPDAPRLPPLVGWFDEEAGTERSRRVELYFGMGRALSSEWSRLVLLGIDEAAPAERVLTREMAAAPGPLTEFAATHWWGRGGVRLRGGAARSCLAVGGRCLGEALDPGVAAELGFTPADDELTTWLVDVSAIFGLRPHRAGQRFRPFGVVGLGGVAYDVQPAAREALPTFVELGGTAGRIAVDSAGRLVVVEIDAGSSPYLLEVDEPGLETAFAFVFGLGADLRVPIGRGRVGLRVEASDQITRSPLGVRLQQLRGVLGVPEAAELEADFGHVHNLRAAIGLVVELPVR